MELDVNKELSALVMGTHKVYRHFKGEYFYVTSISRLEKEGTEELCANYHSVTNPTSGVFVRPIVEWFEEVPENKVNPTGQKYRFEPVFDLSNQLKNVPTEKLMQELLSRSDSPITELDLSDQESCVFCRDWVTAYVMEYNSDDLGLTSVVAHEDLKSARDRMSKAISPVGQSLSLFKRILIEIK